MVIYIQESDLSQKNTLSKEYLPLFSFSSLAVSKGKINEDFGKSGIRKRILLFKKHNESTAPGANV